MKIDEMSYNANYEMAKQGTKIPFIGKPYLKAAKFTCDWLVNPLVINGTHAGCDAIDDVYHGLPNRYDGKDVEAQR